ncbi:MAG: hypothetical protein WBI07_15285, partial [Mobilitalea sp.]
KPTEVPEAVKGKEITLLADLNHDGEKEQLRIDTGTAETEQKVTLSVIDQKDKILWSEETFLAHTGWNSLYLCTWKEEEYLLRYLPTMYQGMCSYSYELFYLDESGKAESVSSDAIDFSINPGDEVNYDAEELAAFAEKVNAFLENSILIVSTEEGVLEYSTEEKKITRTETYSWLEDGSVKFESEELLDRLTQYEDEYLSHFDLGDGNRFLIYLFGASHNVPYQSEYNGEDYDGDGLLDSAEMGTRKRNTDNSVIVITFGNGEILYISDCINGANNFKIAGSDLNGDGVKEIIIISDLCCNGGDGAYELMVYTKKNDVYVKIPLPEGYDAELGFDYPLEWDGKTATITYTTLATTEVIDNSVLESHYIRTSGNSDTVNLEEMPPVTTKADGVCDFTINTDQDVPVLILKQYLTGPSGSHADCIGYVLTELSLSTENVWKIINAYYLVSD